MWAHQLVLAASPMSTAFSFFSSTICTKLGSSDSRRVKNLSTSRSDPSFTVRVVFSFSSPVMSRLVLVSERMFPASTCSLKEE